MNSLPIPKSAGSPGVLRLRRASDDVQSASGASSVGNAVGNGIGNVIADAAVPDFLAELGRPSASEPVPARSPLAHRPSPDERYPTQPFARLGFATILLTFGVFGTWAALAPLQSAVNASGVVTVEGNRKLVQHLEGGIVSRVLVDDFDHVKQGQPLIELSPTNPLAAHAAVKQQSDVLKATQARLTAEQAGAKTVDFGVADLDFENADTASAIKAQRLIFEDRRASLDNQLGIIQSRIAQFKEIVSGLAIQRDALTEQRTSADADVVRLQAGVKNGVVAANVMSAMVRQRAEIKGSLGNVVAEMGKTEQSIGELELERAKALQDFRERATNELRDTGNQLAQTREKLVLSTDTLDRTEIRSPVDGVVQNLKVHTIGGVIRPAEPVMEIVPTDEPVYVTAHLRPTDIDNVKAGDAVEVRLPALGGRLMPMINGKLVNVSSDVMAPQSERDQPYYAARIAIDRSGLPAGVGDKIMPGMPAEIFIATGEHSLLGYLVGPLETILARTFREE